MALTKDLAAAIARELSPEHYAHGWRPVIEAEVGIQWGWMWIDDATLLVDLNFESGIRDGRTETECPCGETVMKHTDPRLSDDPGRELLAKVTGIDFRG